MPHYSHIVSCNTTTSRQMAYNCFTTKCRWQGLSLAVVKPLLLLAILCALGPPPLCEAAAATVCYVKPTNPTDVTCPSEPCYTLDEYVNNSTRYFVSNTVFMFLSGNHCLSNSFNVSGVSNLTLKPHIMSGKAVQITTECNCVDTVQVVFEHGVNVTISSLETHCVAFSFTGSSGIVSLSHLHMTMACEYRGCFINTTQDHCNGVEIWLNNVSMECTYNYAWCNWPVLKKVKGVCATLCASSKIAFEINNTNISSCNVGLEIFDYANRKQAIVAGGNFSVKNTAIQESNLGLLVSPALQSALRLSSTMKITLDNVSFRRNGMGANIYKAQEITFHDCAFTGNSDSAIIAINSILHLTGNVNFTHNTGRRGGAVSLRELSIIRLPKPKHTHVRFENNTATDRGGALFFSNEMIKTRKFDLNDKLMCPFVLKSDHQRKILFFVDNKARTGVGNAIYGSHMENECLLPQHRSGNKSIQIILDISHFQTSPKEDLSAIVSDNYAICACENQQSFHFQNCALKPVKVYPGQLFTLSVAVITITYPYKTGIIPTTKVNLRPRLSKDSRAHILDKFQVTDGNCTNLTYSILSSHRSAHLNLSINTYEGYRNYNNSVEVHFIRPCPIGFSLNFKRCSCNELLKNNIVNVHCNISQHNITWPGQSWIGVTNAPSNDSLLAVSSFCQNCKNGSNIAIDLDTHQTFVDEDAQCEDNHSGVLCGGCKKNYSLALGSNKCKKCTSKFLSLIVAFLAAGFALVFFIKTLNLIISHGTLNGLIFYANIVGGNPVIFPITGIKPFFSVFISWVNLDLGIETCFFDGMDAYAKAWLQFIFPVYVWAIALFIIVLSHYSTRASKMFGNDSVPVLATLLLLSYAKLLRAVISALSVAEIQTVTNTIPVWEGDGNIQYLTGRHIPLFVFALAVLLLLWFPFTLVLVSIQWLQRGTHYRVLHWVTKLMPFFDAFTGPLKEKHRYWVGTFLLVRCILLIIFSVSTKRVSLISALTTVFVALVYLASVGSVYQKRHVAILELFYILNLGLLSALMLLVRDENTLLQVSVGIAFGQFVVTVIYLNCLRLAHMLKRLFERPMHRSNKQGTDEAVWVERNSSASHFSHTSVEMDTASPSDREAQHLLSAAAMGQTKTSNYRESLLEYVN